MLNYSFQASDVTVFQAKHNIGKSAPPNSAGPSGGGKS